MGVCPQPEACNAGRAFGSGQLRIRGVPRVVPGRAPADELEVDVGVPYEDDSDETAVAVDQGATVACADISRSSWMRCRMG